MQDEVEEFQQQLATLQLQLDLVNQKQALQAKLRLARERANNAASDSSDSIPSSPVNASSHQSVAAAPTSRSGSGSSSGTASSRSSSNSSSSAASSISGSMKHSVPGREPPPGVRISYHPSFTPSTASATSSSSGSSSGPSRQLAKLSPFGILKSTAKPSIKADPQEQQDMDTGPGNVDEDAGSMCSGKKKELLTNEAKTKNAFAKRMFEMYRDRSVANNPPKKARGIPETALSKSYPTLRDHGRFKERWDFTNSWNCGKRNEVVDSLSEHAQRSNLFSSGSYVRLSCVYVRTELPEAAQDRYCPATSQSR
jgi:hypothetical protein